MPNLKPDKAGSKRNLIKHTSHFSKAHIVIISIIFAAIGGITIYKSFAATSDIKFPSSNPTIGGAVPTGWNAPGIADWTTQDYQGATQSGPSGAHPRTSIVADPLGSGMGIYKFQVNQGDSASIFGGQRNEMWRDPHDVVDGDKLWRAVSVLLGDGTKGDYFPLPTGWGGTFAQVHDGGGASPVNGVYVQPNGNLMFAVRSVEDWEFSPVIRGQRLYFVWYTEHTSSSNGVVKFWWKAGSPPDINQAPAKSWSGMQTQFGGNSWDKIGYYMSPGSPSAAVYHYGFGRSASATTAMANARFGTVSNPPPTTPTVSISASPPTITSGSSSTLTWNSTNATSCTASNAWSGSKATSGTQSVSPTATSTYSLSCTGPGGSTSANTTITVNTPATPKPNIPTNLKAVAGDKQVTLTWNANPSSDNVDTYQVYEADLTLNLSIPSTQTSYVVTKDHLGNSLVNGTSYSFRVSAHNNTDYGDWSTTAVSATPAAPAGSIQGDLNNDGHVTISDLSILMSYFGTTNTTADINKDGSVNITDLSILLSHYGT